MRRPIEIRHLQYFLAVAETENFTRAAQRLRVTQPSVSQQVAQLERVLGTPLLLRIGKRVQLTEAGAAFRKGAEVVLRRLEDACRTVLDVSELVTGHVDLGVIPPLHVPWVPAVLTSLARSNPGVTVTVQERYSSSIEIELEHGRLDLGFGLATRVSPGIRYERLVSEPLALVVGPRHGLAARPSVGPDDLRGERLVFLPNSFDIRRFADEYLRRVRVRPKVVFEIDNIDSVLACVRRVGTPTLLPPIVLRGREGLGLRAIPLSGTGLRIDFGILWPRASQPSPAALLVADALKASLDPDGKV